MEVTPGENIYLKNKDGEEYIIQAGNTAWYKLAPLDAVQPRGKAVI